jgi:hypothetical protein
MSRRLAPLAAAVLALAALPAAASAVEIGGSTTKNAIVCPLPEANSVIGATTPYTVAADGVITRFHTTMAGEAGALFLFRTFRPSGVGFVGVGRVPAEVTQGGAATAEVRVPVEKGDRLGLSKPPGVELGCMQPAADSADAVIMSFFDETSGLLLTGAALHGVEPNVAATLEPDADRDGFGDESQDGCPSDAARHGECAPPPVVTTAPPPVATPTPLPAAATPPVATVVPAAVRCVVPRLRGLTRRAAARRLRAAHCRLGSVKRGRRTSGRLLVARQSATARSSRAAGSRVAIVLA